jgi:predicted nucleotidyltransferase
MDIYQLKWTRLQSELFRVLCIKAGQNFNLRELAKLLKVSPTAVSKSLPLLEKEGFIQVKKSETMKLFSISFNRDNPKAIELKRVENLKLIYEVGLPNFLFEEFAGSAILLFGSYSRGEDVVFKEKDSHKSDIDIAIISRKKKDINLEKFEKLLDREITLNFYDSWNIDKHLRNNILNGIVLSGSVEL